MRETTVLTAPVEKTEDVEITELEKIEADRVDGVGTPASGFPILMMKGIAPAVAEPAAEEPQESAATKTGGVCGCGPDCAACNGAQAPSEPSEKAVKAARRAARYEELVKAKYGAADRKKMAANGQAMADESYPIADAEDLDNAVRAVGRGKAPHGKIKAHIKRRAKALGMASKLPDSYGGGAATTKASILTMSQAQESSGPDTPDAIKKAVTEALAASEERIQALEADLAKVKATPIPGGPHIVTSHTPRPADQNHEAATKATRLRAIAAQTADPEVKRSYLELAAREEGTIPKG